MTISLVVCTYRRPRPVLRLLEAVARQTRPPDEVLVVDASPSGETEEAVQKLGGVLYSRVPPEERGLTRQRNWGIARTHGELVAFLDDDTVPEPGYFEEIEACFARHPEVVGVGGYIANEVDWQPVSAGMPGSPASLAVFRSGGWERREDLRWRLRRRLGLDSPLPPGWMPATGHARPVSFLPPDGEDHRVELFMGGAATWRRGLLERVRFSPWFEGYGLYEDLDFCLRASREGSLWLCTRARLAHLHDEAGRPGRFRYGRMVVRNGWQVWRLRWPDPAWPDRGRWWATTLLLAGCRLGDAVRGPGRAAALAEAAGRLWGAVRVGVPPSPGEGDGETGEGGQGGEVSVLLLRLTGPGDARALVRLAEAHPGSWIAWLDPRLEPWLTDPKSWPALVRHPLQVLHLGCFQRTDLLAGSLGYVDFDSPWLLPGPADRRFGTWLISPAAGLVHAAALRALAPDVGWKSLAGFLFDLGLRGIRHGLAPASEPALLRGPVPAEVWEMLRAPLPEADLARLIRRGYGRRWVGFWLLARLLFERRLPLTAGVRGWLAAVPGPVDEAALGKLHPIPGPEEEATVDVLIPTLGRPGPLRDVLDDLSHQTLLPRRVIVVDQAPSPTLPHFAGESASTLSSQILIISRPEPGVCRARNAGLREARSEWVLLLDDDVRLRPELISYLVRTARAYGVEAVTAAVHLPGETVPPYLPRPWPVFASGASLVSARALAAAGGFDERLEGGYGEDYEFGVRLRLAGAEVLYAPGEPVLHLKAPAGGFRDRTDRLPWSGDPVPPRPAPPVLYSRRKHHTPAMRNGYRLYYSLKRLSRAPLLAWPRELRDLSRQWESAMRWAERMSGP